MGRSRSPRGGRHRFNNDRRRGGGSSTSEWISRQVAGFGRYPDKRPDGLRIQHCGGMLLEDLYKAWGRHNDISQQEIFKTIQQYAVHEDDGTSRFVLEMDSSGRPLVRVNSKRHAGGEFTPRGSDGGRGYRARGHNGSFATSRGTQERLRGVESSGSGKLQTSDKLDMSLDDVMYDDRRQCEVYDMAAHDSPPGSPEGDGGTGGSGYPDHSAGEDDDALSEDRKDRRRRVMHQTRQMGLTPDSRDRRQPPRKGGGKGGKRGGKGGGKGGHKGQRQGGRDELEENVSRYISWFLKKGEEVLNIPMRDGWVSVKALAASIGHNHRSYGYPTFKEDELTDYIFEIDRDGRFEISGGMLRKVEREERQARPQGRPRERDSGRAGGGKSRNRSRSPTPRSVAASEDGGLKEEMVDDDIDGLADGLDSMDLDMEQHDVPQADEDLGDVAANPTTVGEVGPWRRNGHLVPRVDTADPTKDTGWTQYCKDDDPDHLWWYFSGEAGEFYIDGRDETFSLQPWTNV
eukprot:TRINITY_DN3705_c0_g4_i1.p1 TRINITY_DN3705_c0_g4~~TRINITY_DN3705_c0_g4_i1.p1  ORF type:complete len:516 (-),score=98.93 TRINITY_DN3705_c0_g4_i1:336-1883(-)